jgi:hypothetical protein
LKTDVHGAKQEPQRRPKAAKQQNITKSIRVVRWVLNLRHTWNESSQIIDLDISHKKSLVPVLISA